MRTLVLEKPGCFVSTRTAAPGEIGPGEALVQVRRIGVCGTDLHAFHGRQPYFSYPRILGHELGVEVVAVGKGVTDVAVGDRCAVEPYLNCGSCLACRRGKTNCCVRLEVLGVHIDGGMREQIVVPARKLHRSRQLSLEQLALIETLAIGCHAVARHSAREDETCLVIGAGPIGLATLEFVKLTRAPLAVFDTNERRLDFCRQAMGVQRVLGPSESLDVELRRTFGGELPEVVFDATGSSASMSNAFTLVAPGGRLVYVGLTGDEVRFRHSQFHKIEGTLLCSRNALADDFRRIIGLVENGRLDTQRWITHRAAFDDAPGLFPALSRPETGAIKAVLEL